MFSLLTACGPGGIKYIDDWYSSIVAQKYRPIEVIFVDDLSRDGSWDEVQKLVKSSEKKDIHIKMVSTKRKLYYGLALKEAATAATGDYLGILDIDDQLCDHSISHVVDLYKSYPTVKYIYSQFLVCDCEMNPVKVGFSKAPNPRENILTMGKKYLEHVYSHFRTFSKYAPSYISIFPKTKYAVDQYMGFCLEERTVGMFTNRVCYKYRSGCENTISAQYGSQRRQYWFKLMEKFNMSRLTNPDLKIYPILTDSHDWTDENNKLCESTLSKRTKLVDQESLETE